MSSLELAAHLKLEPKQVYAPCSILKGRGALKAEVSESDGTRRWIWIGKK